MIKSVTVAQGLADSLAAWGVRFIFGTAGDTILPFLDLLKKHPIRFIQFRHEESAAYAASAYAKVTGELGVVLSHAGPGAGHLVNGLADALRDRVPVLAITGQVESMYLGTGHKQYINQQKLLGPVTLRSENLGSPASLQTIAADMVRTALSQAGPVHISIPKDFWHQEISSTEQRPEPYLYQATQSPDDVIKEAGDWLKGIQKPMILVGRGAWQAVEQVITFADELGAGIVRTLPLVGIMPDHPLVAGGLGEGGSEAAIELLRQCDGLIKVGATYWPPALTSDKKPVLSIDAYPGNISRGIPADFGIVGDAKTVLSKLIPEIAGTGSRQVWSDQVKQVVADWRKRLADELESAPEGYPGKAIRILSESAARDALICLDVGEHVLWFNRFFQGKGQQVLVTGRWRGMGFSLGAGIAAQLAEPDSQVICVMGDGGFSMVMGDFVTAVELGLPITFILMNNRSYAMEANAMASAGFEQLGVALRDVRYDQIAEACGGVGYRVTPAELKTTLEEAKGASRPVLIDLHIDATPLPTSQA